MKKIEAIRKWMYEKEVQKHSWIWNCYVVIQITVAFAKLKLRMDP